MHDGRVVLHQNDCRDVLRGLADNSIDSVVSDPPYFLTSIVKRFGKDGAAEAQFGTDGAFKRLSGGFMNKQWDAPDVPPIDPGFAHYMAGFIDGEGCFHVHKKHVNGVDTYDCQFSMTLRADDRPIVEQMQRALCGIGSIAKRPKKGNAQEQVRFCVSSKADCMLLRAVLSAFPLRAKKARDFEIWCQALDAWVDHVPGSGWDDISYYREALMAVRNFGSVHRPERLFFYSIGRELMRVLKPGGHLAMFNGSRTYHHMVCGLEDAGFEVRDSIMWIYGSGFPKSHNQHGDWEGWGTALKPAHEPILIARKPLAGTVAANLAEWGVGAINVDGCRVEWPDGKVPEIGTPEWGGPNKKSTAVPGQNGETVERVGPSTLGRWPANVLHDGSEEVLAAFPDAKGQQGYVGPKHGERPSKGIYGDFGARPDSHPRVEVETSAARFFYCAKASRADRDAGLDHLPKKPGGMVSNTSGQHMTRRDEGYKPEPRANTHPTVKPTTLMQWLCRLITPPGGVILDPFMGSGSTGKAAVLEGFQFIGCEREDEYMPIAMARIAWAIGVVSKDDELAAVPVNDNRPADLFGVAA